MSNAIVLKLLEKDYHEIQNDSSFNQLTITCDYTDTTHPIWRIVLCGKEGTYWMNQIYDLEIHFSRHHPYEPPRIIFPMSERNLCAIKHPMMTGSGYLQLESLNNNHWMPHWHMNQILLEIMELFTINPKINSLSTTKKIMKEKNYESNFQLLNLSTTCLHSILNFLSLTDIHSISLSCKRFLRLIYNEDFWAKLYYSRSLLNCILTYEQKNLGPLRVFNHQKKCFEWEDARESFICSYQSYKKNMNIPSIECFIIIELSILLSLCFPLKLQHLEHYHSCHPNDIIQSISSLQSLLGSYPFYSLQLQRYMAALRYRCVRSIRLSYWLFHHNINYMNRYISFFRWNILPFTTLQFLNDVSITMGMAGSNRDFFKYLFDAQSNSNEYEKELQLQQLESLLSSMQNYEAAAAAAAMNNEAAAAAAAMNSEMNEGLEDVTSYTNRRSVNNDDTMIHNKQQIIDLLLKPQRNEPDYESSLNDLLLQQSEHDQILLELMKELYERHYIHSKDEDIDSFELNDTQYSSRNNIKSERNLIHGPDVYDFIERLHEINIAYSYRFRAFHSSTVDCLDRNNDWVPAVISRKFSISNVSNPFALESSSESMYDQQAYHLMKLLHVISTILEDEMNHWEEQKDHDAAAIVASTSRKNTNQKDCKSNISNDFLKYTTEDVLDFGCLRLYRSEHDDFFTNMEKYVSKSSSSAAATCSHQQGSTLQLWICLICSAINDTTGVICKQCRNNHICNGRKLYIAVNKNYKTSASSDADGDENGKDSCRGESSRNISNNGSLLNRTNEQTQSIRRGSNISIESSAGGIITQINNPVASSAIASANTNHNNIHINSEEDDDDEDEDDAMGDIIDHHVLDNDTIHEMLLPHHHHNQNMEQHHQYLQNLQNLRRHQLRSCRNLRQNLSTSERNCVDFIRRCMQQVPSPFLFFDCSRSEHFLKQICLALEEEQETDFKVAASFCVAESKNNQKQSRMDNDDDDNDIIQSNGTISGGMESINTSTVNEQQQSQQPATQQDTIPFSADAYASVTIEQLSRRSIPFCRLWPSRRPELRRDYPSQYRSAVENNIVNGVPHARLTRHYDSANLVQSTCSSGRVTASFVGYDKRFDETLPIGSARVKPYRSHSHRSITVAMQQVREIVDIAEDEAHGLHRPAISRSFSHSTEMLRRQNSSNSDNAMLALSKTRRWYGNGSGHGLGTKIGSAPPKFMNVRLRCLWRCSEPGCGLVRYHVASTLAIKELLADFCGVQNLCMKKVQPVLIDMVEAVRYSVKRRNTQTELPESELSPPTSTAAPSSPVSNGLKGRNLFCSNGRGSGIYPLDQDCSFAELGLDVIDDALHADAQLTELQRVAMRQSGTKVMPLLIDVLYFPTSN